MTSFEASLRALQVGSTFPHADLIGLAWANDGAWTVLRLAHAETSLDFTADRAPCRAYAFFLRQEGDSTPWGVVAAFSKEGSWMHAPRADGVPTLVTWPVRANADASRLELEASFVDAVDARAVELSERLRRGHRSARLV